MDLYASITKWQSGIDMVNNQNCFALNFGYNGEIPFPSISLGFNAEISLDKYEFQKRCKCYYVFVGSSYVEDLKNVMEVVEGVSKIYHGIRPNALFIMGKYSTSEINKISKGNLLFTQ